MVFTTDEGQNQNDPAQSETTEVTTQNQDGSYVKKLVEAKGSNWGDPEVLAKGKLEADGYIATLESQLSEMRDDLGKQDKLQAILDQLQNTKAPDTTKGTSGELKNNNGSTSEGTTTPQELSEERLKSLVEETLTQRDSAAKVNSNLTVVDEELARTFGTEAKEVVEKKARELGMDLNRLKEIASESPNAFFTLIGEPKKAFSPLVQGSVRTEGVNMQTSNERNFGYYQKLRRENRKQYYSPDVQQKMMLDADRLGDSFYGKT